MSNRHSHTPVPGIEAGTDHDGQFWISRPRKRAAARLRMFCFGYAGVGPSVFRTWPPYFDADIEVGLVQLPGRESRWKERPFTRLAELVPVVGQALLPYLTVPCVFYGHSLGALVSFELIRHLRRNQVPLPLHLFVSATRAPQLPYPHPPIWHLTAADFVKEICGRYDGIPREVFSNAELMELMLPALRADVEMFETYRYTADVPLACPISAFGGSLDRSVSQQEVEGWRHQTSSTFRFRTVTGNHFFLQSGRERLLAAIAEDMRCHLLQGAGQQA